MADFTTQLIAYATPRNLLGVLAGRWIRALAWAWLLAMFTAAPSRAMADAPAPDHRQAVQAGLHLRAISALDDAAHTFDADFDFWLRYGAGFEPEDILFLDTAKPVALGAPIAQLDSSGEHYRLYRLQATLRYKVSNADLVSDHRDLVIRISPSARGGCEPRFEAQPGAPVSTSGDASSWLDELRADDVLAALDGWSLLSASLTTASLKSPALGDPRYPERLKECPALVASIRVERDLASPRGALEALHSPPTSPLPFALALILLGASLAVPSRLIGPRLRSIARVVFAAVAWYCAEPLILRAATSRLSFSEMENLVIALRCAWWLLPAVAVHRLLPAFVWEPISKRSGHPIPSITRTLVPIVGYAFVVVLIMRFVFGESLTTVWAATGVLSVVLGIALQNLILDAFAGLMLNMEKPFKILHWISMVDGETRIEGQVLEMNWRATLLLSRTNDLVSVPNSKLAQCHITNFALPSAASRLEFSLELSQQVQIKRAQSLIKEGVQAAITQGRVLAEPQPRIILESTSDQAIRYKIQFFVNLALVSGTTAVNDVLEGVIERLNKEGIYVAAQPGAEGSASSDEGATDLMNSGQADGGGELAAPGEPAPPLLTEEQIALVQGSWALVVPIADAAAELFYNRLFELDPSLRALFRTDPQAQRSKLIGMLAMIVKGLSRLDGLIGTVQDLALRHTNYGVLDRHYDTVGEALLWTLDKGLGDKFTLSVRAAWVRAYTVLSATMKAAK